MTRNNSIQIYKGGWEELENAVFTDNQVDTSPSGATNTFAIKPDGTELYVLELDTLQTFPLAIPYDPDSLGTLIRSFVVTDDATPVGITFRDDGTQMFVGGQGSKVMLSYTLPVPFDTDSIVASPASKSLSAVSGPIAGSTFSRDGDFFFVTDQTVVYSFPLPTPWDITSNVSSTSRFILQLDFMEASHGVFPCTRRTANPHLLPPDFTYGKTTLILCPSATEPFMPIDTGKYDTLAKRD